MTDSLCPKQTLSLIKEGLTQPLFSLIDLDTCRISSLKKLNSSPAVVQLKEIFDNSHLQSRFGYSQVLQKRKEKKRN